MSWYSQAGQDKWVHELHPSPGFFVDLGAYDGVQTSNTLALELLGWTGICVEANVDYWNELLKNRPTATNVHAVIAGHRGYTHFEGQLVTENLSAPRVRAVLLSDVLDFNDAPDVVDYLSIDIEGMEFEVLEAYDFSRQINLMTVEHNLYCDGPANKDRLFKLLTARGFVRVVEDAPCLDPNPLYYMKPYEDWYSSNAAFLRA